MFAASAYEFDCLQILQDGFVPSPVGYVAYIKERAEYLLQVYFADCICYVLENEYVVMRTNFRRLPSSCCLWSL